MDAHMYRVGQMVTIAPREDIGHCRSLRQYKVLSLLPAIAGAHAYRVKAIMEREPRVVLEAECSAATAPLPFVFERDACAAAQREDSSHLK